MKITEIQELKAMGGTEIVELSGWGEKPFVCQLRRVGMYEMMAHGSVPNPLMPVVQDLFMGMQRAKDGMQDAESARALLAVAEAAMVQPSYKEVTEAGIQLTDAQVLEIFFFATRGPAALAAFRGKIRVGDQPDGGNVPDEAQQPAGD